MTSKLTITDERVISVIERLGHYAINLKWADVRGAQDLLAAADGLRELQERRKAAMDSEPVGGISIDRLLQLLYQFDGANECAASIGDQEYALECGDVASALRELLSCRSALPVADVVAWSHPNEERKCDIRWRRHDVEPGPLYRHAQPAPVVPDEMLCEFYEVDSWPDLVRELVKHVEQLQDSAKRNVKPWEDTFPETLLPAYIERIKQADEACRAAMLNGVKS